MEVQIEIGITLAWLIMVSLSVFLIIFSFSYRAKVLKSEAEKQIVAFRAAIEAEEKQKVRIAHNIHDEISGKLAVLSQRAERHKKDIQNQLLDPEVFDVDIQILEQISTSLKAIVMGLVPPVLLKFGLVKSLEGLVVMLGKKSNAVEFEVEDQLADNLRFTETEQVNIYRICSEILNNLSKHAAFGYLRVSLKIDRDSFFVFFIHDGIGISSEEASHFMYSGKGLGLKSVKSRCAILNANLNYIKDKTASKIILSIPFKP